MLTCGDDLLVCLRDDLEHIPWPAHWDLPGGGAEPGETPEGCALRELEEEFGLRFPPARLEAGFTFPNPHRAGRYSVFFTGRITPAEIAGIRFGDEGQCWRMMPLAEYLTHPRAVPHFPAQIAHCLGLTRP
ncbi:NUDIX domain-containing protein [Paracoccus sp. 12-3]|nr:NUDIX domain-containing protein [Paracoccus xiamenensis]